MTFVFIRPIEEKLTVHPSRRGPGCAKDAQPAEIRGRWRYFLYSGGMNRSGTSIPFSFA